MQSNLNTKAERVQLGTLTCTIQNIPSLKLTCHLKLDRWKTILSFWDGDPNLAGDVAVSFRDCFLSKSFLGNITWQQQQLPQNYGDLLRFPFGIADMKTLKAPVLFCPHCQRGDCYPRVFVSPLFLGAYGTYGDFFGPQQKSWFKVPK